MNYRDQAAAYGMSYEDFMGMVKENSTWWEEQVVAEMQEGGE